MSSHHLIVTIASNTPKRGFEPVGLIYFDWKAITDESYAIAEDIARAWLHTDETRLPLNRLLSICRNLNYNLANEYTQATPSFIIEEFGHNCDYASGAFAVASDTEAFDELCDLADANITFDITNNRIINQVFHIYDDLEQYQRIQGVKLTSVPIVELHSRIDKSSNIDNYPIKEAHRAHMLIRRTPKVFQIPDGLILEKIVENE